MSFLQGWYLNIKWFERFWLANPSQRSCNHGIAWTYTQNWRRLDSDKMSVEKSLSAMISHCKITPIHICENFMAWHGFKPLAIPRPRLLGRVCGMLCKWAHIWLSAVLFTKSCCAISAITWASVGKCCRLVMMMERLLYSSHILVSFQCSACSLYDFKFSQIR